MKKIILLLFILLLIFGCWKKQSHDITRPVIPNYIFNGTAMDYDSGEKLAHVPIKLSEYKMLYDVEFGIQIDTTDSNGFFEFDPVYPGYYFYSFQKDGYWLFNKRIEIHHKDTTTIIKVPQVYFAQEFKHTISTNPALAISGSKAWCNEFWFGSSPANDTYPFIDADLFRIYKQTNKMWNYENFYISPFYRKNLTSMAFGRNGLYACVAPDTLYIINTTDGTLTGKYQLSQNISGITFYPKKNCIYSCSNSNIYQHEPDNPGNILQSWNFDFPNLSAMAYYRYIYAYDNNEFLLRQYDEEMNVLTTFALINSLSNAQVFNIFDMSFDGYGALWISLP
ncbi:hypothetical protein JXQ31_20735 [candidate division KSB1 bacterium]|nr:hypothetical protein [candidate division KSB1 bacterium]